MDELPDGADYITSPTGEIVGWRGRSYGRNPAVPILFGIALATFIGGLVAFAVAHVAIGCAVCGVALVCAIVPIVLMRVRKWHNPHLLFVLDDNGFYFSDKRSSTYFHAAYDELAGYRLTRGKNGTATVRIAFRMSAKVGAMGRISHADLIGVYGADKLEAVLLRHAVPREE